MDELAGARGRRIVLNFKTKDTEAPVGFELTVFRGPTRSPFELYVPICQRDSLVSAHEKRVDELRKAAEEQAKASVIDASELKVDSNSDGPDQSSLSAKKLNLKDRKKSEEVEKWQEFDREDEAAQPGESVKVFDSAQALNLKNGIHTGDSDLRDRLALTYAALRERRSTHRKFGKPNSLKPLFALKQKFPNFAQVVDWVISQVKVILKIRRPMRIAPMLLVGPPGIGKTHFANELGAALGTSLYERAFDSDLTSSLFLGSDKKWGNSQHGLIFEALALGEYANPVCVIDELDKVPRNLSYGSATANLYSLLEPRSSARARDISLEFELNASFITWLFMCNSINGLDAPILSRLKVFNITQADAVGSLQITGQVMLDVLNEMGLDGFDRSVKLRRHIAHLDPREARQLTEAAVANAVLNGRLHLEVGDFPEEFRDEKHSSKRKHSGYLH